MEVEVDKIIQIPETVTKTNIILYTVDVAGSFLSILFVAGEVSISSYILYVTAVSITFTLIKKMYDLVVFVNLKIKKREIEKRADK